MTTPAPILAPNIRNTLTLIADGQGNDVRQKMRFAIIHAARVANDRPGTYHELSKLAFLTFAICPAAANS
jgi:hypothetical protein